jgi:hypothetical protein
LPTPGRLLPLLLLLLVLLLLLLGWHLPRPSRR